MLTRIAAQALGANYIGMTKPGSTFYFFFFSLPNNAKSRGPWSSTLSFQVSLLYRYTPSFLPDPLSHHHHYLFVYEVRTQRIGQSQVSIIMYPFSIFPSSWLLLHRFLFVFILFKVRR